MSLSFEIGPIRPPSEAQSLLLRITRNCPWNKCKFCHVYKKDRFSLRSVEEIKNDIDAVCNMAEAIFEKSREPGINGNINDIINHLEPKYGFRGFFLQQVAYWLGCNKKSVFLQDADSLILKTDKLTEVLNYLRSKLPGIDRITAYSRSKTISRKSPEELKLLRNAGLNRIHIGMESGSDKVLDIIKKGVSAKEHINAGRKLMEAGFELSVYYMPGIGGLGLSKENAIESARVINEINPTFIRIRSTVVVNGTPLFDDMINNKWKPVPEDLKVKEIKLFIEGLDNITSTVVSDHIMNLLEDIEGKLPDDKDNMLDIINKYMAMSKDGRESFIVGRRTGRYRYLADYEPDSGIEKIKEQMKEKYSTIDEGLNQLIQRYL